MAEYLTVPSAFSVDDKLKNVGGGVLQVHCGDEGEKLIPHNFKPEP